MSITETYSAVHEALLTIARQHDLTPADVRLLVALAERGGEARTDDLERDMRSEGTAIRRSSLVLRDARLLTAWSSAPGQPPRPGIRSHLSITARGQSIAVDALARVGRAEPVAA